MMNNEGRQKELDIARGLAVIFMVLVHILLEFGNYYTQMESIYGMIVQWLGGVPAAPVFMFLLGVGVVYSRKSTPLLLAKRGLLLFAGGYALNLLRSVIPAWTTLWMEPGHVESFRSTGYENFFYIDILQFAGLTMLFFAVTVRFKFSALQYAAACVLFAIVNLWLAPYFSEAGTALTAPFIALWFGNGLSYFPFFTWVAYPIAGFLFGYCLIRTADKPQFYKRIFGSASVLLLFYYMFVILLHWPTGYESEADYYHHTLIINVVYILFILFWISSIYFASRHVNGLVWAFLRSASALTTEIYILHFLLIGICTLLIYPALGLVNTILLTILTYTLSHYSAHLYVQVKKRKRS